MPVPTWAAADETDPFDGSMPQEVGLPWRPAEVPTRRMRCLEKGVHV